MHGLTTTEWCREKIRAKVAKRLPFLLFLVAFPQNWMHTVSSSKPLTIN
jgi:hypothetical protein